MASEMTLRIMQRIVDRNLGEPETDYDENKPVQSGVQGGEGNLSSDEERVLMSLISQDKTHGNNRTIGAQSAYAGGSAPARSGNRPNCAIRSQRMNLSEFVQSKKK